MGGVNPVPAPCTAPVDPLRGCPAKRNKNFLLHSPERRKEESGVLRALRRRLDTFRAGGGENVSGSDV